ncbi:quinone oxidoreductase [Methylosinus sp. R-45379]|jgi:NADPH2:quinone reductase|uniref:quinone oxidoreductase family protein n=1 Tax=unclassified Methylosinus TaxID=2624500 RepID=UPI00047B2B7F|nr:MULTISPECIES: quinone oxidoreductase [unclassified Methylosinus]OAI27315.1 quinone oxidoreductase [Methylosinus sp. R-45379]TDX64295.1 NADPH2:quinone reductase [Methylosinus sp. sav-2]
MVKAIRIYETGGPQVLRYEEVELPAPGPGEAQIVQRAIGVNYIDVYLRSGAYPADLPFIPGYEGAGEVVALGEGVDEVEIGERVAYVGPLGGYAAARNIPAASLVRLPKSFSFETGASMMLKGLTAQYLLRRTFKVKEGDRILVHAGAGGVGQLLCQWGSALGAHVIATVGDEEKAKIAKEAGAAHTILYRSADFVAAVREITNGKLCDVVYDGVGRDTFPASLDCLKPFGLFVSYGSASGKIEAFDINLLSQKGSLFATRPSLFAHIARRKDLEKMTSQVVRAIKKGVLRLERPALYRLEDAALVHADLEARRTTGALVLIP